MNPKQKKVEDRLKSKNSATHKAEFFNDDYYIKGKGLVDTHRS